MQTSHSLQEILQLAINMGCELTLTGCQRQVKVYKDRLPKMKCHPFRDWNPGRGVTHIPTINSFTTDIIWDDPLPTMIFLAHQNWPSFNPKDFRRSCVWNFPVFSHDYQKDSANLSHIGSPIFWNDPGDSIFFSSSWCEGPLAGHKWRFIWIPDTKLVSLVVTRIGNVQQNSPCCLFFWPSRFKPRHQIDQVSFQMKTSAFHTAKLWNKMIQDEWKPNPSWKNIRLGLEYECSFACPG